MEYPSLHNNNTMQKILLDEVLYAAEQMKRKWLEERNGELSASSQSDGFQEQTDVTRCFEVWIEEQTEHRTVNRYVCVPLAALWHRCPQVRRLSASVDQLRVLLADEPKLKLCLGDSAVMLKHSEPGESSDEEEEEGGGDFTAGAPMWRPSPRGPEEDWEAEI